MSEDHKFVDMVMNRVRKEVERVSHGKITIEINESRNSLDIVTEERKRMFKEQVPRPGVIPNHKKRFRKG